MKKLVRILRKYLWNDRIVPPISMEYAYADRDRGGLGILDIESRNEAIDLTWARTYLQESLALAEAQNDPAGIARVLLNLGNIAYEEKDYPEARTLFAQSLAREQELGNHQRVADALINLGVVAIAEKRYPQATEYLTEALTIHRRLANHYAISTVLVV